MQMRCSFILVQITAKYMKCWISLLKILYILIQYFYRQVSLTTLEDADEELFTPIRTMLEILNAFAEERNYEKRKKEKAQK